MAVAHQTWSLLGPNTEFEPYLDEPTNWYVGDRHGIFMYFPSFVPLTLWQSNMAIENPLYMEVFCGKITDKWSIFLLPCLITGGYDWINPNHIRAGGFNVGQPETNLEIWILIWKKVILSTITSPTSTWGYQALAPGHQRPPNHRSEFLLYYI